MGKMRAKISELTEALIGHFDAGHAELARSTLGRLDAVEADLDDLDAVIATDCRPSAHEIQLAEPSRGGGEGRPGHPRRDRPRHVPLPSAAHLAAWAGVAPAIYESAGKRSPSGARHGSG